MKSARLRLVAAAFTAVAMFWITGVMPSFAQSAPKTLRLWVDQKTGQVFIRPGRGRTPLEVPSSALAGEIEQKVQRQTQATLEQHDQKMQAELKSQQQTTQQLASQVNEIKPAWQDYLDNWKGKFKLGATVYADWRIYTHTGFHPQEITQINNPGPGNEAFNSFDITRTYLNFLFFPADGWTVRITPNVYRQTGSGSSTGFGRTASLGFNLNGNLGLRMKYTYLEYNKAFDRIPELKGGALYFGQVMNPLVDWEESLYGYRFTSLVPWNYLSLSSTQAGLRWAGPIRIGEKKYADYDLGVFNNASFHTFEQNDLKQVMGRISFYPLGGTGKHDGLGFTGFYNYGYGNVTPDFVGSSPFFSAPAAHVTRIAALVHYTTKQWGLAFEYDAGNNAFSSGNLFSGGSPTAEYADFGNMAKALLNNGHADEQGFDAFGHYNIPNTPFTVFGLFQWFQPNTNVNLNPLDFQRWVAGVSYQYNKHLRFALSSQNSLYYHSQFDFSKAYANTFASVFSPSTGVVADAVPRDVHAVFLNVEFSY